MKQTYLLFFALVLSFTYGCKNDQVNTKLQKNKEIATRYHDLNPNDIDTILAADFIGRNEKSRFTWNVEDHRKYLTNGDYKVDAILQQVAEGNWVATRFVRTGIREGDTLQYEMMHFKRFENGKIAEIWEYGDSRQVETVIE
ncbi:MAG TPA: nuclear transport factor 2 family protein [Bacteroidales bacterium]|nr:nuclear transport factor 2 family protein [Bacteroidales bacterium]